jgi:hypothetical protein
MASPCGFPSIRDPSSNCNSYSAAPAAPTLAAPTDAPPSAPTAVPTAAVAAAPEAPLAPLRTQQQKPPPNLLYPTYPDLSPSQNLVTLPPLLLSLPPHQPLRPLLLPLTAASTAAPTAASATTAPTDASLPQLPHPISKTDATNATADSTY